MPYSPGGYSWLGISAEPKNVPMTDKEKSRLDNDIDTMENAAIFLENKIRRYHALCKQYELEAGTEKGEKIFEQLEILKKEIQHYSKEISRSLEDSSDITHLGD